MVWQCCSSQHHASVLFLSASVSEASVNIINLFVGQGNSKYVVGTIFFPSTIFYIPMYGNLYSGTLLVTHKSYINAL